MPSLNCVLIEGQDEHDAPGPEFWSIQQQALSTAPVHASPGGPGEGEASEEEWIEFIDRLGDVGEREAAHPAWYWRATFGETWRNPKCSLREAAIAALTTRSLCAWALPSGLRVESEVTASAEPSALESLFLALAEEWRQDTGVLSSVTAKSMHPAYQRIIGMGRDALPLILRELMRKPDHWFWALTAITGEDPVPAEDAGRIQRMAEAWIRFGEERGYL